MHAGHAVMLPPHSKLPQIRNCISIQTTMKFGNKLLTSQYQLWSEYYLNYEELKDLLKVDDNTTHVSSVVSVSSMNHPFLREAVSIDFLYSLNRQVEKILLFFLSQQGLISTEIAECRRVLLQLREEPGNHGLLAQQRDRYQSIALDLLRLVHYVDLNVTGLRKILKKHDKISHKHLSTLYLGGKGPVLQPLLEADTTLSALLHLLEHSVEELKILPSEGIDRHVRSQTMSDDDVFQNSWSPSLALSIDNNNNNSTRSVKTSSGRRKRYSAAKSASSENMQSIDLIIWQIHEARRNLKQTSDFVQYLASTNDLFMLEEEASQAEGELPSQFSNLLNLLSTFLYMTNYYIVAPTSGSYAEKLGGSVSLSGVIIGMTPAAALVSTILYSWWTSHSYKAALLFASSCSIAGNLFYAVGLPCDSISFVVLGRLLNGFGSARSINRRYIADTFSSQERTAASAAFVTAGALGMAAGPAISSLLHNTVRGDNMYWQIENSPGWFMAILWTIYIVCLVFYFDDPPQRFKNGESRVQMSTGEGKALLSNSPSDDEVDASEPPIWLNIPAMTTFTVYFVLKLVLEFTLNSTSTITRVYFGWSDSWSGIYMAALGLLMLPANMLVAYLSITYTDRDLILLTQAFMFAGCVVLLQYTPVYPVFQYILGSLLLFLSTNAMEGPNMSLLSRAIPKSWSRGVFNVGFLATEAGTLGRALGDVFLTLCGSHLLNQGFGLLGAVSATCLLWTWRVYDSLKVSGKDD